ncbi:MAG: LicD family protein [bacterium]|nr:LicD family protein [bacterium]
MPILNVLKKYPEIELFSREKGYELYSLITDLKKNDSPFAYLVGIGIPVYSAFHLIIKLITDFCRIIDTLIQSLILREYAGGNIQTLLVDANEYGRSVLGILAGALVAVYSPSDAAELFLTVAPDPALTYLTAEEGARLYAMGDRLHAFFVNHQIDYRICSGTALGAFREKGIIHNDDDMDLIIHPDSVDRFSRLCKEGTLSKETGISIAVQPFTGGWQSFYADSPKGQSNSPLEHIGKPFVDIFPGTRRLLGGLSIITYGEDRMYLQSKGDYFTDKEWGLIPTEYEFGPTTLYGVNPQAMKDYLSRSYGSSALRYVNRLFPHEVYSAVYASPLSTFSILSQHPAPRCMRHVVPAPLGFDKAVYELHTARTKDVSLKSGIDAYTLFHQDIESSTLNTSEFAYGLKGA